MIIYKIASKIDGKIYIGQTVFKLSKRWKQHCKNKHGSYLHNAIRLYGIENFTCEQIDLATTVEELNIKEQTYIKAFNCLAQSGYNLKLGGSNHQHHPETRARMSASAKKRIVENGDAQFRNALKKAHELSIGRVPWNKGKPTTKEVKNKQSEAHKGQKSWNKGKNTPKAVRLKQSVAKLGRHLSPETQFKKGAKSAFKGRKHTPEALLLISVNNRQSRSVICVETNEVFNSVKAASEKYSIAKSYALRLVTAQKMHPTLKLTFKFH